MTFFSSLFHSGFVAVISIVLLAVLLIVMRWVGASEPALLMNTLLLLLVGIVASVVFMAGATKFVYISMFELKVAGALFVIAGLLALGLLIATIFSNNRQRISAYITETFAD